MRIITSSLRFEQGDPAGTAVKVDCTELVLTSWCSLACRRLLAAGGGNEAEERVFLGEHQIFPQEPGLHSVVALDDPVRLNAAQHDTEETLVCAAATSAATTTSTATATATLTPQHIRRVQRCTEGGTFGCFLRVAGQVPDGGWAGGELEEVHESHKRHV